MYTISDLRNAFKAIGYRITTKRNSDFIFATVFSPNGIAINGGNVYRQAFLDEHKPAFDLLKEYKGKVFDGMYRVIV